MLRSVASKLMWMGRATSGVVGLAILFALAVGATNTALAHTGVDAKLLHLGHSNRVGTATAPATAPTALVSTLSDAVKSALVVTNKSGGPALSLGVADGQAPLKVSAEAGTATNLSADELDGLVSTEFANAAHAHSGGEITSGAVAEAHIDNAIARDSEVANGFIEGRGLARHRAEAMPPDGSFYNIFFELPDPGLLLSYRCPTDLTTNGWLRIRNTGSNTVNVFSDNGSTNPNHFGELAPNGAFEQGAAASGEYITLQVQGSTVTTIDVFSAHRSGDCHVQAQALVTKP